MTKILHTSDWHVGRRIRGRDRSDEHEAVLAEIAAIADGHGVDLTIVSGDVFDTASPSPRSEEIVWRALLDLAATAPVAVIAGNHDNPRRLRAVTPLLEMGRVRVVAMPARPDEGGVVFYEQIGLKLGLLPFVSQRGIVKASHIMETDPDQHAAAYEDRLRVIVERLTEEMGAETANVFSGHLTVHGAMQGGGERRAHIFDYAVPTSVFPTHLSYVALGHLHRQQKMPHPGAVWYAGSPLQLDFGEVGDQKGVLVVDASPGLPAQVTSVPLEAGRPLVTVRGSLDQVAALAGDMGGAFVKVELVEKARVGLADEVRELLENVVEVVLDSPEAAPNRVEPRQELEPADAFHRYLAEKAVDDPDLEKLFSELLDDAAAATP